MALALTKTRLVTRIARKLATHASGSLDRQERQLSTRDVDLAVKHLVDYMADTLVEGGRIEVRGFGSFSLHYRAPRLGRNPKTGDRVKLAGKYVPHFKSGKELRDRVNQPARQSDDQDDAVSEAIHG